MTMMWPSALTRYNHKDMERINGAIEALLSEVAELNEEVIIKAQTLAFEKLGVEYEWLNRAEYVQKSVDGFYEGFRCYGMDNCDQEHVIGMVKTTWLPIEIRDRTQPLSHHNNVPSVSLFSPIDIDVP